MQEYEYIELMPINFPSSLPGPRYNGYMDGAGNWLGALGNEQYGSSGLTLLEAYGVLKAQGYDPFDKDRPILLRRPKP